MNLKTTKLYSISRLSCKIGAFMFIAACSDNGQSNQANNTATTHAADIPAAAVETLQLNLPSTAIDQPTFLGQIEPPVQTAAPCPYLTDEGAMAIIRNKRDLKRRETSNERCYWSMNAGFSVKLTLEPLASAKPIQERAYNMDSPPQLAPQPGPGNNATVLYDTVWDKAQAYAMGFEQDNKLVMLYVTGMATDAELLTTAANVVASNMQAGATLAPQPAAAAAFDMCSIWDQATISDIMGQPAEATTGTLACKWTSGSGDDMKQIDVNVYYGKNHSWDYLTELGAVEVPGIGEGAMMLDNRKKSQMPSHVNLSALYVESLVNVRVTESIENHKAVAVTLAKNINSRFN